MQEVLMIEDEMGEVQFLVNSEGCCSALFFVFEDPAHLELWLRMLVVVRLNLLCSIFAHNR